MMTKLLEYVGVPQRVLNLIPETVGTCQLCRAWTKPGPSQLCCDEDTNKFNEHVECDLVYLDKQHIIVHMLDKFTQWQVARLIHEISEVTLKDAIDKMWVSTYGPPNDLCVVGETGAAFAQDTSQCFHHNDITLHQRAKHRQARPIARRGLLLKACIHRIMILLQIEGLAHVSYETILEEAVRCINAALSSHDIKVGPSDW